MNGQIVGNWKRVFKKDAVVITPYPFTAFTDAEYHAFITAAHHYGKFLDLQGMIGRNFYDNTRDREL